MKIFSLDARKEGQSVDDGLSVLVEVCGELGVNLVCHPIDYWESYGHPDQMFSKFQREVEESSLLLSLGSFFWVKYFHAMPGFRSFMHSVICNGKPFIFQSVRGWETYYRNQPDTARNEEIRLLFRLVGVEPTQLKVFTDDYASAVGGGSSAYFRSGDNCFLNADVLGDSEAILLNQPNILAYEGGAFPVVETGALHELVNSGDQFDKLSVGLRPAVFVEVKSRDTKGFVIGGNLLGDGYDALDGFVPGAEKNVSAIRSLIKKAVGWSPRPQSFESKLYQDLHDFERGLGDILNDRLPDHETALIRQSNLREIIDKVVERWSLVSDLFDYSGSGEFSRATSAIPAGARRYLSHPIQLNYDPDGLDGPRANQLAQAAEAVRRARARLRGGNDDPT